MLAGEAGTLAGCVEFIEPMGSQVMIQVAVGPALVTAQFERGSALALGGTVGLAHRPGAAHAFDPATERSVVAEPMRQEGVAA